MAARFGACGLVALGCGLALGMPELAVRPALRLGYLVLAAGITWAVEIAWPITAVVRERSPLSPSATEMEFARIFENRERLQLLVELGLLVLIAVCLGAASRRMFVEREMQARMAAASLTHKARGTEILEKILRSVTASVKGEVEHLVGMRSSPR